jgi:tetratricopeptide (TPR) repeat protein
MLRVHLAQILYNPSYYEPPVDFLEEPSFLVDSKAALGRMRSYDSISSFLIDSKSEYLAYLKAKVTGIIKWSSQRKAHLIVFPEYSIPYQLLPHTQELAKHYGITIIAGTHRVRLSSDAQAIYRNLGIHLQEVPAGSACSPVICETGNVLVALKAKQSKWEPNLFVQSSAPKIFKLECQGEQVRLSVIPCIDCLHPEILGELWTDKENHPRIVICPSQSPAVEPFTTSGAMMSLKEVVFGYVNSASFGGTFFNIPTSWSPYIKGVQSPLSEVPKRAEAILELDVDQNLFFLKKGSVEDSPICSHPRVFPIVYEATSPWMSAFLQLQKDLIEWLTASEYETAVDWLDSYLSDNATILPEILASNLKHLRHCILPLFDGNIETIEDFTEFLTVQDLPDTPQFWSNRVDEALKLLSGFISEADVDMTEDLFSTLRYLKELKHGLPQPISQEKVEIKPVSETTSRTENVYAGGTDLIESFQNRGGDLELLRNFLANPDNRVILVTGAIGIGKTDFINWVFRKQFGDWQAIRVPIARESRFPRVLAEIAYRFGINLDIDSLSTSSSKVFRQKVQKVLTQFFNSQKRALILDDLHNLFKYGTSRDHTQLSTFVELAAGHQDCVGGRVFLISSQWVPEKWLHNKGTSHLRMRAVKDIYTRRIIEYHMRRLNLVADETIPELPQELLDVVKGHPLSAKLVAESLRTKEALLLNEELAVRKITGYVAKVLIENVALSEIERNILQRLSVFRLPINLNSLIGIPDFAIYKENLSDLFGRCILSYDGNSIEMHEAVRRYFESGILPDIAQSYHGIASKYYEKSYSRQRNSESKDPSVIAELVHHLTLAGKADEIKDLRLFVVQEILPAARKIYKKYKNYTKALSLFRMISNILPDHPEILAYVGRCYARLSQWSDCDNSFQLAIDISKRTNAAFWWLYRDWGHIRARYGFYQLAFEHFTKALSIKPFDASIKGSLGYMNWKQGNLDVTYDLFEEAIRINPNHEYTLTYYSKYLDMIGQHEYARILRERLEGLEEDLAYREPYEYDIDVDYDD